MPKYVLEVNGERHDVECDAKRTLLSVLRDDLDLTGTKYACGEGQCGACSVLLDGRAVRSCTLAVSAAAGRKIVTIEGLAKGNDLHPVQQAFVDKQAFQCGFCTPGMVIGAVSILSREPKPTAEQVKTGLQSHICRCGTYPRIVEAVLLASRSRSGS